MKFTRDRRFCAPLLAFGLALASASWSSAAPTTAPADAEKFLRFVENGPNHQLQTSIVHYQNDAGATVDLIGAVHIADSSYFDQLNERFKIYDALLYEMVKPKGMVGIGTTTAPAAPGEPAAAGERRAAGGWISFIQRFMKDQLELDFQLDRIDYTPANFVHADLDAETFLERQTARGESMLTLMLNQMMRELNNPTAGNRAAEMGLMDLVEALQSPDRARQLKLVLGRQFQNMDAALDAMGGPDGSVILTERNEHAMKVLRDEIKAGKKKIGVFYGAAHLRGMEEILVKEMAFKQVGEPEWLVAWDMPDRAARPAPKAVEPATAKPATRPAAAR